VTSPTVGVSVRASPVGVSGARVTADTTPDEEARERRQLYQARELSTSRRARIARTASQSAVLKIAPPALTPVLGRS
jgi:hypothetical protein